jgi:hypothetical protein
MLVITGDTLIDGTGSALSRSHYPAFVALAFWTFACWRSV